jgi:hypothetical protein
MQKWHYLSFLFWDSSFLSNFGLYLTHLSMFNSKILTFMFNLKFLISWTMFIHIQLPKFRTMASNCDKFNSSHNKRRRQIYLHLFMQRLRNTYSLNIEIWLHTKILKYISMLSTTKMHNAHCILKLVDFCIGV